MNKIQFKSKKEAGKFLTEKGIDTTNWTKVQWLKLNKGQSEIHMMQLAECMYDAYNESTPKLLQVGEWHIPFEDKIQYSVQGGEYTSYLPETLVKISTAMCARVSYTVVGEENKTPNYDNDIKLHNRLIESGHASPGEHIARVMTPEEYENNYLIENNVKIKGVSRNFRGFWQYRQIIGI